MLIILLLIAYTVCAFATMVVAYHWARNSNPMSLIEDGIVAVIIGIIWPIPLCLVALYSIVPAIKYVEQLIYKKK